MRILQRMKLNEKNVLNENRSQKITILDLPNEKMYELQKMKRNVTACVWVHLTMAEIRYGFVAE